jgi:glutamine amidotransferase
MCIAIYKPKNKTITEATLAECFRSNRDGAGFMYVENKQVHIEKGFFTFNEFYEAYKPHENKQCLIHFRIKTHGPVAAENCHPFEVNQSLGFIHNGIINGYGSADASDTRDFNAKILQPLVAKWGNLSLFQPAVKSLIESRIGYSKLVFLDRHGNVNIFNEGKGIWEDGVWYSNSSFRPYVPTYNSGYKGGTAAATWKPKTTTESSEKKVEEGKRLYSTKLLEAGKKAFRILQAGDNVCLTRGHWSERNQEYYSTDTVFEVISINSNYTATLAHEEESGIEVYVYDIPFSKIDFAEVPTDAEDYSSDDYYTDKIASLY